MPSHDRHVASILLSWRKLARRLRSQYKDRVAPRQFQQCGGRWRLGQNAAAPRMRASQKQLLELCMSPYQASLMHHLLDHFSCVTSSGCERKNACTHAQTRARMRLQGRHLRNTYLTIAVLRLILGACVMIAWGISNLCQAHLCNVWSWQHDVVWAGHSSE